LHINHTASDPLIFHPSFPDHTKHQLRVEPFPSPRGHSLIVEVCGDLAASQTAILKPQDAVDQGLMSRVKRDQRQRLGPDGNPKTEVVFRRSLKVLKGKSEITPP